MSHPAYKFETPTAPGTYLVAWTEVVGADHPPEKWIIFEKDGELMVDWTKDGTGESGIEDEDYGPLSWIESEDAAKYRPYAFAKVSL